MKILQIITLGDSIGGAQIHVLDLSINLHERGHDVHVLTGTFGELNKRLTQAGVPNSQLKTMHHGIRPLHDIRCFMELRQFIKAFKPDVVAAHSSKAGIIGRLVCFFLGIPNTFTVHGWSFKANTSRMRQQLYFWIEKFMGIFSCKLITVAPTVYELGIKHKIVPPEKLVIVLNGVRDFAQELRSKTISTEGVKNLDYEKPTLFQQKTTQPSIELAGVDDFEENWLPEILNIEEENDTIKLVMSARFQREKDHETLIKALIPLKNEPFHLQLLGDGTETLGEIQNLVKENDLTKKIAFVGFTNNVLGYLQQADVCILTSHTEGLPLSILEAMSLGLPIVASNVGGISNQVENGCNGYLVKRNDVEDLTEKIKLLMNNSTLRRQMGRNSRVLYEKEFKLEKMVDKTLAVYMSVLR